MSVIYHSFNLMVFIFPSKICLNRIIYAHRFQYIVYYVLQDLFDENYYNI